MKAAGGSLVEVVSLRIYIIEQMLSESRHIKDALKAFFPAERAPAATWMGVRNLANTEFLVEIEAAGVIEF
jgi:2-iminobutanoate/2-iminopropanoate deaminase